METKSPAYYSLVWIDLEMTGLDAQNDTILEIATIITNDTLDVRIKGPTFVIQHSKAELDTMNDWCKHQHGKSGLTQAALDSKITLQEAEQETLNFIKAYCLPKTGILCGNSIWQDRIFLNKYMPELTAFLHYRMIDVTSIKEAIARWYPNDPQRTITKKEGHRALDDIEESINELETYRASFFKK